MERRAGGHLPGVLLAALGLVAAGLILYSGRETTFFFDEWDFVLARRGTSADTLLSPHVGHLSLVPILVYKGLLTTVGLDPYWPYRAVALCLHLACVALLYAIARRQLGPWPALGLGTLLMFLGYAWQVLLWPFEISYLSSLAAGMAAWLALQRRTGRWDAVASVLLGVALASSGVGLPVALGVLVGLVLGRGDWRRAWVVATPLALYAIWLVTYGLPNPSPEGGVEFANLPDTPGYMASMAAAAVGGISGLGTDWGRIGVAVFGAVVVARILRHGLSPELGAGLASLLGFWILTGLARADLGEPTSSRYIYPSAVFLLLVAVELPATRHTQREDSMLGRRLWLLASLGVAFAVLGNAAALRDGGRELRAATNAVIPALAALEVAGESVRADARPEPHFAPQIVAAQYLEAARDFGSALPDGLASTLGRHAVAEAVDGTLLGAESISLVRTTGAGRGESTPPKVVQASPGRLHRDGDCVRFAPAGVPALLDVRVPPGSALLVVNRDELAAEVRLRRFAEAFPPGALGSLPAGVWQSVSVPRDSSAAPWTARISPAGEIVTCLGP